MKVWYILILLSIFVFYGQTNDINTDRIAVEEGKIKSTDNPITNYLPEFKTKRV
jgi:hypothetical protein